MDDKFNAGTLIATLRLEGSLVMGQQLESVGKQWEKAGVSVTKAATTAEAGSKRTRKATGDASAQAAKDATTTAKASERSADGFALSAEAADAAAKRIAAKADAERDAKKATDDSTQSTKQNQQQQQATAEQTSRTASSIRLLAREWTNLDESQQQAAREVATNLGVASAALTGLATLAVARASAFDSAMSQVSAATGETTNNMRLLRAAAIDAGQSTQYTAEAAAQGQVELAKAGVSTAAILSGGLAGALNLAAAGQIEVAEAAETAATAMTQFRLSGEQVPHLADLLAAGAGKAQGGVTDLSYALRQSGLVASQFGLSVEETIGGLTAFASAGLLGSDAGTSFRTMLLSLANPSAKAAEAMRTYNIQAYDAEGNFVGLTALAGQLKSGFEGATQAQRDQALATIFGTDAIRGANVLYEQGAVGIRKWEDAVNDSGYAQRQAAELTDNLAGDIERLGGAFDTALIVAGTGANDMLRGMTQTLTGLIDLYGQLPEPIQQGVLMFGGLIGILGLVGAAAITTAVQVTTLRTNLQTLGVAVPATRAALGSLAGFMFGPWGAALTIATVGLGRFIQLQAESAGRVDAMRSSLNEQTGALTDYSRDLLQAQLAADPDMWERFFWGGSTISIYDRAKQLGIGLDLVTEAAGGSAEAMDRLREAGEGADFDVLIGEVSSIADETNRAKEQQQQIAESMGETAGQADAVTEAFAGTTEATVQLTEAQQEQRDAAQEADASFIGLGDAMTTVQDQQRELAEQTAESTESSKDSWTDYYDGVSVSTEGILEELRKQVEAQTNWETNMLLLAGRVSQGVIDELTRLGPEGAPAVAALVQASDEELGVLEERFGERAEEATARYAEAMLRGAPVIAEVGRVAGEDAAKATAEALLAGQTTIEQIVSDYSAAFEDFDPKIVVNTDSAGRSIADLKDALDSIPLYKQIQIGISTPTPYAPGRAPLFPSVMGESDGGVLRTFANGGVEQHVAQIARPGDWRLWAEPETGGEAYIPLAMSKRGRSESILRTVADLFGHDVVPRGAKRYADGDVVGAMSPRRRGTTAGQNGWNIYLGAGVRRSELDRLSYRLRVANHGGRSDV